MSVQLARKWRSKNFDEVVGQDLAVRLLKNSLFKQYFLPVYLFSGLRGSGKTSLARIFASAVNCAKLDQFSKDPKIVVPCASCASCQAAFAGKHPDIIELDAASHTGVDNMRTILESASFLPSLGRKRIYIIDEAHMLSRAAFNACLKLFEEPPAHVLFILATTDPEKIIDTIMSRSFQVFFDPIPMPELVARLAQVCDSENIAYDQPGLAMIAGHAHGSARDALTALERIALATGSATEPHVYKTLGLLSPDSIQKLFIHVCDRSIADVMSWIHTYMTEGIAPITIWRALMAMLHDALLSLYQIEPTTVYSTEWRAKVRNCTAAQLGHWFSLMSQAEQALTRSSANREVLIGLLVQLCVPVTAAQQAPLAPVPAAPEPVVSDDQRAWHSIVKKVLEQSREPMARTLFTESRFKEIDRASHTCIVQFLKEHELFSEWVDKLSPLLSPMVPATWPDIIHFKAEFTGVKSGLAQQPRVQSVQQQRPPATQQRQDPKKQYSETINQALKLFPGTVSEL